MARTKGPVLVPHPPVARQVTGGRPRDQPALRQEAPGIFVRADLKRTVAKDNSDGPVSSKPVTKNVGQQQAYFDNLSTCPVCSTEFRDMRVKVSQSCTPHNKFKEVSSSMKPFLVVDCLY
jgi:hypothetical protein